MEFCIFTFVIIIILVVVNIEKYTFFFFQCSDYCYDFYASYVKNYIFLAQFMFLILVNPLYNLYSGLVLHCDMSHYCFKFLKCDQLLSLHLWYFKCECIHSWALLISRFITYFLHRIHDGFIKKCCLWWCLCSFGMAALHLPIHALSIPKYYMSSKASQRRGSVWLLLVSKLSNPNA